MTATLSLGQRSRCALLIAAALVAGCATSPAGRRSSPSPVPRPSPAPRQPVSSLPEAKPPVTDAAALCRLARETYDEDGTLGMLLPTEWPSTSGLAMLFAYRVEPLPTGIVQYAVHGPTHVVELNVLTERASVRALESASQDRGKLHDVPEDEESQARRAVSERALIDVIGNQRSAPQARRDLLGYCAWMQTGSPLARDAARHIPGFFAWLDCPGTQAARRVLADRRPLRTDDLE